jgi:tetratricopeptide (TPR) repeat protein
MTRRRRPFRVSAMSRNSPVTYRRGELSAARALHLQALEAFRTTGYLPGQGGALRDLGLVAHGESNWVDAERYFDDSLAVWRRVGDNWGRGAALRSLANLAYRNGDYRKALLLYRENLELFRVLGFIDTTAWSLNACGDVLRCLGEYDS